MAQLTALPRQPTRTRIGLKKRFRAILRVAPREMLLALRAVPFVGNRHVCPCCGFRTRAFSAGGASLRTRSAGYCPRCGSKARHRRIWLFLARKTNVFSGPLRLLEVSPHYSFSRQWTRGRDLSFLGAGLSGGPYIRLQMDLASAPLRSASFDAILCVHVLEEIPDDRTAMQELFRLAKPGGWVLVSVPTRMDRTTYEDPSIVAPTERRRAFGEEAHVRIYGSDLIERLEACGFRVEVDLATNVDPRERRRYGLRDDENIFLCSKPR
jgi:SAM-dependent methyltransferase